MENEIAVAQTVPSSEITSDTQVQDQAVAQDQVEADGQETEPAADDKPKNDPEKLAKALDRYKSKIDRKTAALYEERRRNEQLLRELEQYRSSTAPQKQEPDEVEKFVDDRAAQKARAILQEEMTKIEQQRTAQQRAEEFKARVATYSEKMPDIMDVLDANREVDLPSFLVEAIATIPEGPMIAAYAFKEDLMDDLAEMSPPMAYMELARIRTEVMNLGTAKPVTKAPPPMSSNRGTSQTTSRSIENMPSRDLYKWYRAK